MAKINRVKVLAEAIASAFEAAGYAPAEILQGPIVLTDMAWQAPPLRVQTMFEGLPFSDYVDYPLPMDSKAVFDFYRLTLFSLHACPEEVADENGYKGLARLFKNTKVGERNLAFPLYDGWPAGDHNTGPMFALEAARLFYTSSDAVQAFKDDADNYHAVTPWGTVGIVDGYVAGVEKQWDVNCSGLVQGLLEMPRGVANMTCMYDTIARLRSALHEAPERFGTTFEPLDLALQALRVLTDGETCRELHRALEQMSLAGFRRRQKIAAYTQCLEVMDSWALTDRAKISMLQEILMPQYMNLPEFGRKILDPSRVFPAVLSTKTEARIKRALQYELDKVQYAAKALQTGA